MLVYFKDKNRVINLDHVIEIKILIYMDKHGELVFYTSKKEEIVPVISKDVDKIERILRSIIESYERGSKVIYL